MVEVKEPTGWVSIPLCQEPPGSDAAAAASDQAREYQQPLKAFFVQASAA